MWPPEIEGSVTSKIDGQIAEIDENLERRELDAIERAELMARRIEMVEARRQVEAQSSDVSAQPAQKLSARGRAEGRAKGGVSQTARDLGVPRDKVRRSLAIAGLAPDAKAKAAALGLTSNKAALIDAARQPDPAAQAEASRHAGRPERKLEPARADGRDLGERRSAFTEGA